MSPASSARVLALLGLFCAAALGLGLAHVHLGSTYPLREFDTLQRAGSARQLIETGQWSALTLRPWELIGHEHQAGERPWPVRLWSVGYPLLLAAGFAVFGAHDWVTIAIPLLGYVACVALVFLLGLRLWGRGVAALAALLLLADRGLVHWSAAGHLESVYTALGLLAAWLILRRVAPRAPALFGSGVPAEGALPLAAPPRLGPVATWALGSGLLLGAMYLLRPTALAWLPLLALCLVPAQAALRRRALAAGMLGVVLMVLAGGALTRALSPAPLPATGPEFSYTRAELVKHTPLDQARREPWLAQAPSWGEIAADWPVLVQKLASGAFAATRSIGDLFPLALLLLAPLGFLLALERRDTRLLAGAVLAALVLQFGGCLLTAYSSLDRYAADFVPWLALFGAVGLAWGYRRLAHTVGPAGRAACVALVLVVVLLPPVAGLAAKRSLYRPAEGHLLARQIAPLLPPDALIASPLSADLSWWTGHRTLHTPDLTPQDLLEVDRRLLRLHALVIEQEAFGDRPPPAVLGPFALATRVQTPWRVAHGVPEYHHWLLYVREADARPGALR